MISFPQATPPKPCEHISSPYTCFIPGQSHDVVWWRVNNNSKRTWKEVVDVQLEAFFRHVWQDWGKAVNTSARTVGGVMGILTPLISNKVTRFCFEPRRPVKMEKKSETKHSSVKEAKWEKPNTKSNWQQRTSLLLNSFHGMACAFLSPMRWHSRCSI